MRAVGVSESFRHQQLQDLVYKATCIKKCNYMYLGMIRYNNLASFFFLEFSVTDPFNYSFTAESI